MMPATPLPLRDIHVPSASWWPLAPGWWLLAVLSVAALVAAWWWWRRWRKRRAHWAALESELRALRETWLADSDRTRVTAALSALIRRAVRARGGAAHLDGEAWRGEVERVGGPLPVALEPLLGDAVYRRDAEFDVAVTLASAERWLRGVTRKIHA